MRFTIVVFQKKKTPLHIASEEGHDDIVKYLLESKANPNTKDKVS